MPGLNDAGPLRVRILAGAFFTLLIVAILCYGLIRVIPAVSAFKEETEISAEMHDETTPGDARAVKALLDKQPYIRSARIVTKEEALKAVNEMEGSDVEAFLGYNPLFTSVTFRVKADNVNNDSLLSIRDFLLQDKHIRDVTWSKATVADMNSYLRKWYYALAGISVILLSLLTLTIRYTARHIKRLKSSMTN